MSASAVRMRALRRRQRDGKVPLRLEADEVGLQEVLIATRSCPRTSGTIEPPWSEALRSWSKH
jgi:hypothetical protein